MFEIAFAVTLKASEGFTRVWPSVAVVAFGTTSLVLLSRTLDRIPVGTAYAVWTGIGAVGVVTLGVAIYGEAINGLRLGCIALIVAGVLGLRLAGT